VCVGGGGERERETASAWFSLRNDSVSTEKDKQIQRGMRWEDDSGKYKKVGRRRSQPIGSHSSGIRRKLIKP
jgi:hypothetical protein